MKKKIDIKKITLIVLFSIGELLFIVLASTNIFWFAISIIPFVLASVFLRVWYGKTARLFSILIMILPVTLFIIFFIILPLAA